MPRPKFNSQEKAGLKYAFLLAVLTSASLASIAFGFWVSYPVWWDGMKPPKYDFLVGLLGNAVVSLMELVLVTVGVSSILSRREEKRWNFSRQRFANKFLNEVNKLSVCAEKRIAAALESDGVRDRLPVSVQKLLNNNFSPSSAEEFRAAVRVGLARMETLVDGYSLALDVATFDFTARVTDKLEWVEQLNNRIGFGEARAANVETYSLGILQPCSELVSLFDQIAVIVDETMPKSLQNADSTGFARVHTKMLAALIADISDNLHSLEDVGETIETPRFYSQFKPLFK